MQSIRRYTNWGGEGFVLLLLGTGLCPSVIGKPLTLEGPGAKKVQAALPHCV